MAKTIHGWPVLPDMNDPALRLFPVPGVPERSLRLRKDVGPYLVAFASEYHKVIAPLNRGIFDDWSWSPPRKGRASTLVSDHCGGVAIDLNASKEGAQSSSNLSWWKNPVRRAKLTRLRKKYHLLEWGGDYKTFRDPMHWTFKKGVTKTQILSEIARLKIRSNGTIAT